MPGAGSQHNKPHKAGRRAGKSAREKHRDKKNLTQRAGIKSGPAATTKRADRLNAVKQVRDAKKAALLQRRRAPAAPRCVAVLGLSPDEDVVAAAWRGLLQGCGADSDTASTPRAVTLDDARRTRLFLLPAPAPGTDAVLAALDIGRCAEQLVLVLGPDGALSAAGERALGILRALGLPGAIAVVPVGPTRVSDAGIDMDGEDASAKIRPDLKARAAAKKLATATLDRAAAPGLRVFPVQTAVDWAAVARALADATPAPPGWRRHRSQLTVEAAEVRPGGDVAAVATGGAAAGPTATLLLRGYVRGNGLSVRQAVHVPGVGDCALAGIQQAAEPGPLRRGAADVQDSAAVLASAAPGERACLDRENMPDPLAGEQTWPTEEELLEAERERRAAAKKKKRRLPRGTSEYQAAWIVDDEFSDASDDDEASHASGDEDMDEDEDGAPDGAPLDAGLERENSDDDLASMFGGAEGTEFGMDYNDEEEDEDVGERWRRQRDDREFPDEVETPADVLARERFGKYRGLKSMRTSAWDPMESLPRDYAKVYAFDNFARTQKKALAAVASGQDADAPVGAYIELHIPDVPLAAATRVVQRVEAWAKNLASPLTVFGLLEHETKLSVGHYALQAVPETGATGEPAPALANKEEVLLVTGIRAFLCRPVLSSDEHGADKFKMERFLHPGAACVASVYAPIAYPPLPVLVLRVSRGSDSATDGAAPAGAVYTLAATGAARRPDPDRVVLKKIVLAGYPVRTHKAKAVVRHMFHDADDIRWFRPVDLWTRTGRRGRIREPLGTHGAFKAVFDGPVTQADAVCMSLYKRVFPKWPRDMRFAEL